jgi:hypothetical protein
MMPTVPTAMLRSLCMTEARSISWAKYHTYSPAPRPPSESSTSATGIPMIRSGRCRAAWTTSRTVTAGKKTYQAARSVV